MEVQLLARHRASLLQILLYLLICNSHWNFICYYQSYWLSKVFTAVLYSFFFLFPCLLSYQHPNALSWAKHRGVRTVQPLRKSKWDQDKRELTTNKHKHRLSGEWLRAALRRRIWAVDWQEAQHDPAMCVHSPGSQPCPGMHHKKHDQQVEEGDFPSLFCFW